MFIVISVYWKIGDCFLYLMMRGLIYSISCWINHILYCVLVFCSFFVFKSLFCQDKKSLSSERKLVISYLGVLHQATLFSLNYKSFCSIIAIWSVVIFLFYFYQLSHKFSWAKALWQEVSFIFCIPTLEYRLKLQWSMMMVFILLEMEMTS